MKNLSYVIIGLALLSLVGCTPEQQESDTNSAESNTPSTSASAQHFEATALPPNFNQDVHVIKALWGEILKLKNADPVDRKAQLTEALRHRIGSLDTSDLEEPDALLLGQIKEYLKTNPAPAK